jgi:hypothetical protein
MKIFTIFLYAIFVLTCNNKENMNNINVKKVDGLWQFSETVPDISNQQTSSGLTDQYTFLIDNGLITISLFSEQLTKWKADDDVYVLRTKWENNTLLYLPPLGNWTPLADFDGEVFYMSDGRQKKIFRKILKNDVVKWNSAIIKPNRVPFSYDIE